MVRALGRALIATALVVSCGDNRALPIDAPRPDAAELPDLALVTAEMDGTTVVAPATFVATDCEVVEGCALPGARTLLRFATITENRGPVDLDLGEVPPDGVSSGIFTWSPCHMHHHVIGYADYELVDQASAVVATGRKQGFCIEDDEATHPGTHEKFTCHHQGLSVGWADVYGNALPCQWIDITDVPAGTYTLRVVVDRDGVVPDRDPTNNVWTTEVSF